MKKPAHPRQGKTSEQPPKEDSNELRTEYPLSEKDQQKEAEDKMRVRRTKK